MPDLKPTALPVLTSLASGDIVTVVDVSDTTDDAAGSDKQMTGANLATSIATLGALATDAEVTTVVSTHAAVTSGVHGISAFGATLVDDADAAAARTTLGLATIASSGSASDLTSGTVATARLGSGTASSSTFLRGDQTWAAPSASVPASAQPALFSTTNWGLPGWVWTSGYNSTFAAGTDRIHYAPITVLSAITVTEVFMTVFTAAASSNTRVGVYAATSAWQPTGTPVADWGALDCSSTGDKTITGLTTVLTPGRYLVAFLTSSASIVFRQWLGTIDTAGTINSMGSTAINPWPIFASQAYGTLPSSPPAGTGYGGATATIPIFLRWTVN